MSKPSLQEKIEALLIEEGYGIRDAYNISLEFGSMPEQPYKSSRSDFLLPTGVKNLQDYFPTSMLIGGSYARYVEASTKAKLFHPSRTTFEDIDIFIFHNITRNAMENIINSCFITDKLVSVHFETESREHPQYKMDGIQKVLKFEVFDGLSTQKYDIIIIDPNQVHFDSSIEEWFMRQQASELSQICAIPNFSDKGYSILASQDLLTCHKQVHLRADRCTDEFRTKLRKQAQELGYKLI